MNVRAKRLVGAGLVAWGAASALGMGALWRYAERPGVAGAAPLGWPSGTTLPLAENRATLVLFVHPKCPCSQATAAELSRLLTHVPGRFATTVVFVVPAGEPAGWERGKLWDTIGEIPTVQRAVDSGGVAAAKFGAKTSGHALAFGRRGELLFSGGLTAARGHEGDNDGRDALETMALDGTGKPVITPAFGCVLESQAAGGGAS